MISLTTLSLCYYMLILLVCTPVQSKITSYTKDVSKILDQTHTPVFQLFSKHTEKVPLSWAHIGWVELTSTVLLLLGGDINECSRVLKGDKSYFD
jgi:hypothetical protein